jgi:hypothetical protein
MHQWTQVKMEPVGHSLLGPRLCLPRVYWQVAWPGLAQGITPLPRCMDHDELWVDGTTWPHCLLRLPPAYLPKGRLSILHNSHMCLCSLRGAPPWGACPLGDKPAADHGCPPQQWETWGWPGNGPLSPPSCPGQQHGSPLDG